MYRTIFLVGIASWTAFSQECSHLWNRNLEINPTRPKGFLGDTFAGYGLLSYRRKDNLAWIFKSRFPHARFMSIETYTSTRKHRYDVQYDFQFEPDEGSLNPFRDGVEMSTVNRDFTVKLIPAEGKSTTANVIHISPSARVHAIYYRIYAPKGEVILESDLPEIYAVNAATGDAMECPAIADAEFNPNLPQAMLFWVRPETEFEFKSKIVNNGQNSAIPSYQYALNRVAHGDVSVIRFQAPTFFNNQSGAGPFNPEGEVRFWSLCTQNLVKGQTLNCVPDYLATPDASGKVTVVIGKGDAVRFRAESLGYSFLEDRRGSEQPVMQFVYRNLFPTESFAREKMYQGDYQPYGVTCTASEFLGAGC